MESVGRNYDCLSGGAADAPFSGPGHLKKVNISGEHIKDFAIGVTVKRHTFSRLKLLFVNGKRIAGVLALHLPNKSRSSHIKLFSFILIDLAKATSQGNLIPIITYLPFFICHGFLQ